MSECAALAKAAVPVLGKRGTASSSPSRLIRRCNVFRSCQRRAQLYFEMPYATTSNTHA
jgi:hypothetical protein